MSEAARFEAVARQNERPTSSNHQVSSLEKFEETLKDEETKFQLEEASRVAEALLNDSFELAFSCAATIKEDVVNQ